MDETIDIFAAPPTIFSGAPGPQILWHCIWTNLSHHLKQDPFHLQTSNSSDIICNATHEQLRVSGNQAYANICDVLLAAQTKAESSE